MNWILAGTVAVVIGAGVFHLMQRDAIRLVLGFSLLQNGANIFLLQCSAYFGTAAPYVENEATGPDPVPQVLILTAIAIGFAVIALLVSLALALSNRLKTVDLDEVARLRH